MNSNGDWTTDQDQIGLVLFTYFQHLFTSQINDPSIFDNITLQPLNQTDISLLNQLFSIEDIKNAIWKLGAWKAPGLDEIPTGFYEENWDLVKDQVFHTASHFLSGLTTIHEINFVDLVLIPKVKHPQTPTNFRPIGLCNTIDKVISKCLADRISQVLSHIIDENQGAFIKNRGVALTALAGLEIIHQIVHGPKSIQHMNNVAIKLYLFKAYNRIEWPFLLHIINKPAFPNHFINLIYNCLTSTSLSIRFNNSRTPYFEPSRGLHQGDPLFPFLFIICIQGFSAMINHSLHSNKWKPLLLKNQPLNITHLAFADDIILFGQASDEGLHEILSVLNSFCHDSGQQIYFSKSQVIFNKHTSQGFKDRICSILNMNPLVDKSSYLGIPFVISRSHGNIFQPLIWKLSLKTESWHQHQLSKAGRMTMIQSVHQVIPLH